MLTDMQIRNTKPGDKPVKLSDSAGLHLFISPSGGKLWRYRYRYGGKEKLLSLGPYPDISLSDARTARDEAKAKLRDGRDPAAEKRLQKLARHNSETTFEAIAREWHDLNKEPWVPRHAFDVIESLKREVFPHVGSLQIKDIKPADVIGLLRLIEARPAKETARRVRQRMSAVFVYAIATGRGENDPAAIVMKAMAPIKKRKLPAITDLNEAREMLQRVEAQKAHPVTKLATRILALTYVRPGTLITTPWAEWTDIDDVWHVPAARMKLELQHKEDEARNHVVPLSRQAIDAINVLRQVTGRGPYAFTNSRHAHKSMSENAMGYLLNRAGYHSRHCPHGWRSTFSTVMNEKYPADKPIIDLMLAHVPQNKVEAAYNRAQHLERRKELAQLWADLLLEGCGPARDLLYGPRK